MRQRMTVRREVYSMADNKKDKKVSYESQESLYKKAVAKMNADEVIVQHQYRIDNDLLAASMFDDVGDYLDAPELAEECRRRAKKAEEGGKRYIYESAVRMEKAAREADEWEKIEKMYTSLGEYEDAAAGAARCRRQLQKLKRKSLITKSAVLGTLAALVIAVIVSAATGFMRYATGYIYMKAGMYSNASETFAQAGDFLKAEQYRHLCDLMLIRESGRGSIVHYGQIDWTILARDGSVYTMIGNTDGGESALWCRPFDEENEKSSWASSSLRTWLNHVLPDLIFSEEERSRLLTRTLSGGENREYGTAYTEETQDMVTILSAAEAESYAKLLKGRDHDSWLRIPGHDLQTAAYLSGDGIVRFYGTDVRDAQMQVYPVIQADFSEILQ